MKTPEEQKLYSTLEEIIDRTIYGKVVWSRMNTTTFVWEKRWGLLEGAEVTIQKVSKREHPRHDEKFEIRAPEHYIFQVIDKKSTAQMVALSTEDNPDFLDILNNLFEIASTNITREGLSFLRKALDEPSIE